MPAFNEEDVIAAVIDEFSSILERFEHREFIVVNDCSTDGTLAVLQALQQRYPYLKVVTLQINSGHGPALWRAYQESKGDFVFHCDSDRQFLPDDFWLLWEKLHDQDLDVEIGVRTHRKDALSRLLLTRLLRFSLWLLFGVWLQDSNSPFRLYRRGALNHILPLLPEKPLVPSILMLLAASRLKMKIGWVPVRHLERKTGLSFLRSWKIYRLCLPALREVFLFRQNLPSLLDRK